MVADESEAGTEALIRSDRNDVHEALVVSVSSGPALGQRLELDPAKPGGILIGQGPACDVRIDDPTVSRRHAVLELVAGRLRLRDLGSTNGTYAGEMRVIEVELAGGETLRLGATALRIERAIVPGSAPASTRSSFGRLIGASETMRRIYPLCERLAFTEVPVLIEGETGTGKEQLAEALHEEGPRREGPFVVFDCTAVAPSLIESELFGHERGAFTGAVALRRGVFERAHGGTLLIDEIGDLPLELQAKLLRVLERGELTRIGGQAPITVDVRVMAATRRDLDHEIQLGRFRDDLFHRLVVTRVELPPLRDRHGDVALLAHHFSTELAGAELPGKLLRVWEDYAWPGNVRELRNAVARRVALGDLADDPGGQQTSAVRSVASAAAGARAVPYAAVLALDLPLADARDRIVADFEQHYVDHVLEQSAGNVTRAAALAGIGRRHLQRIRARVGPKP